MTSETAVRVPFVDLAAQNREVADEVRAKYESILASGRFIGGPELPGFEKAFAQFLGAGHAVAVSNGTAALFLALKALGAGPGDEVITAANSFVASAEAIEWTGARPALADVDDLSLLVDPADMERRITARTRALLPVHLYGQVADMAAIDRIASARGLPVVEDACQAHGAARAGRRAGTSGRAGAFSFYPAKNLGAPGDGGAVSTSDAALAATIRALADHGRDPGAKYEHRLKGYNLRMNALPAAFLSAHLTRLDARNRARRRAAAIYDLLLSHMEEVRPVRPPIDCEPVYHLYVVRASRREELREHLASRGIETAVHYPQPIHLTQAWSSLGYKKGDFPVAEKAAGEVLSLPIFPTIREAEIETVVREIKGFYARK
ncbi:MAG: DegT/DnrJ/EryC1/StrS family aminotransferase [Planctomycetes bacterium]|nr:DegT/DnrJ/EryC1/StrS family aminotransferase [Planctomycetota bacterium]